MGMAIMPAIQTGGVAVAKAMPGLMNTVSKYSPSAARLMKKLTGSSTPQELAAAISKAGNGMQAQGFMFNALKAGVTPEMISAAVPLLGAEDMAMLNAHHIEHVKLARQAVNDSTLKVNDPKALIAPQAEDVVQIERVCRSLSITSLELVDAIVAFRTLSPQAVTDYRAWMTATGKPMK